MKRQMQVEEMERQREALKLAQVKEEERACEARKKGEGEVAAAAGAKTKEEEEAQARVSNLISSVEREKSGWLIGNPIAEPRYPFNGIVAAETVKNSSFLFVCRMLNQL